MYIKNILTEMNMNMNEILVQRINTFSSFMNFVLVLRRTVGRVSYGRRGNTIYYLPVALGPTNGRVLKEEDHY